MPLAISCPHCEADYKIPDSLLGKTIRCKSCQGAIPVRDPDADEEDAPEPARRKKKKQKRVGGGLLVNTLAVLGTLCIILIVYSRLKDKGALNGPAVNPVANRPGVNPFPNLNAGKPAITDPDQLLDGEYPFVKDRVRLENVRRGGDNSLLIDYTLLDAEGVNAANKNVLTDLVHLAYVEQGQVRKTMLGVVWNTSGTITLKPMDSRRVIPSGTRLCLLLNGDRSSNVVSAP